MFDINSLAARQLKDYKNANPGTCFSNPEFKLDLNSAYKLQDAVTELRLKEGDVIAGYKIGCIGDTIKSQFGMDGPIRGTIFESEVFKNNHEIPAHLFCNLAVEAEMAFTVDEANNIQRVFPVIELHNLVFRGPRKTLPELIGNNGVNAGVIMPKRKFKRFEGYISSQTRISLKINDLIYSTTQPWPIKDCPEGSLAWLTKNLSSHKLSICEGNLVLAGTTLGLYPVKIGDKITVYLEEEAMVSCCVT